MTHSIKKVAVAVVQMTSTTDVGANLERARTLIAESARAGAALVALPESFAYLGTDHDSSPAAAEELDGQPGPIRAAMADAARQAGVWLLLGSMPERRPEPRIGNTSVLLSSSGDVVSTYRKMHLFDVEVPGGRRFRESERVQPGPEPVIAATPWGALGLSICYDLRFPELYRQLTRDGARMLAVPSAFTSTTGAAHWHVLLRARAIENQAFVLAPAQTGRHGGDRESYGHALIADPWGRILAERPAEQGPGFVMAELDFDAQDQLRRAMPVLEHRRL